MRPSPHHPALRPCPDPTLAHRTRAIVAVGGLSDCTAMLTDVPEPDLKTAVLDAVCATLG
ncbi:hypothetical protein ACQEVZ_28180 [Dactylosporangium sp. CA-152071]|uniref:hypothetical protein n=1 Tax=Dactylosporangium sp. CA-152071 TaxID=3239933 RepID=UPI003D941916